MPSMRTLSEAYYNDVGQRSDAALREAMRQLQIAWRKNWPEEYEERAQFLIRRARRLDRLQTKIVGKLF